MTLSVTLNGGSLRVSRQVYEAFFAGLQAVILLRRESDLYILPVRNTASGGYLMKLCNSAGDRVVHADDFFRRQGESEPSRRELSVVWSTEHGGLVAKSAFQM